jgi:hypothetical protein
MLSTPAVDFQGSGALQYLRAEWAERKELHHVMAQWPRHEGPANVFLLPEWTSFTMASGIWSTEFNARNNLLALRDLVRSAALLSTENLAAADAALKRLQSRMGEDVNLWASNLSNELSSHRD